MPRPISGQFRSPTPAKPLASDPLACYTLTMATKRIPTGLAMAETDDAYAAILASVTELLESAPYRCPLGYTAIGSD